MSERVTMPALGESVTEGTVTRWLKNVGDTVAVDEPLLEVSTDKVDTEIPSPVAGVLQEILAGEDDTVPVGADLAVIGDGSEASGGGGRRPSRRASEEQAPARARRRAAAGAGEQAAAGRGPPPPSRRRSSRHLRARAAAAAGARPPQPAVDGGSGRGGETVTMPALGESVTEGTVTRWLKAEGDTVEVDEPLLEVSTDKVDTEIPSPVAGTLTKILVQRGRHRSRGRRPGHHRRLRRRRRRPARSRHRPRSPGSAAPPSTGAPAPEPAPAAGGRPQRPPAPAAAPAAPARSPEPRAGPRRPRPRAPAAAADDATPRPTSRRWCASSRPRTASTSARSRAPASAAGSASRTSSTPPRPPRRLQPLPAPAAAPLPQRPRPPPAAVGPGCALGLAQARHDREDVAAAQDHRQADGRVAAGLGPADHRRRGRRHQDRPAAGQGQGRVRAARGHQAQLPAVLRAGRRRGAQGPPDRQRQHRGRPRSPTTAPRTSASRSTPSAACSSRSSRTPATSTSPAWPARSPTSPSAPATTRSRPDELGGGTFTLTNTGSRGALFDTPIINQPQVAILGTGAVVKRPVVVTDGDGGETIAIRSMVYLALSYDHRIVDGADAARFLTTMKTRLEEGSFEAPTSVSDRSRSSQEAHAAARRHHRCLRTDRRRAVGVPARARRRGRPPGPPARRGAATRSSGTPTSRHPRPGRTLAASTAVVHLAGAGVGDKRWTPGLQAGDPRLARRRHDDDRHGGRPRRGRPPVRLVSGVGRRLLRRPRRRGPHRGVRARARLPQRGGRAWEAAADPARTAGLSVATAHRHRAGARRGAMVPLLPLAQLGLARPARLGDAVLALDLVARHRPGSGHLVDHPEMQGPVNVVGPPRPAGTSRASWAARSTARPCSPHPAIGIKLSSAVLDESSTASGLCPSGSPSRVRAPGQHPAQGHRLALGAPLSRAPVSARQEAHGLDEPGAGHPAQLDQLLTRLPGWRGATPVPRDHGVPDGLHDGRERRGVRACPQRSRRAN